MLELFKLGLVHDATSWKVGEINTVNDEDFEFIKYIYAPLQNISFKLQN